MNVPSTMSNQLKDPSGFKATKVRKIKEQNIKNTNKRVY